MSKSRVFLFLLLSFVAGVFGRSFFELNQNLLFLLLLFSIIFLAIFYKTPKVVVTALIFLFLVFGIWRADKAIKVSEDLVYAEKTFQEEALVEKVSLNSFGQNLIVRLKEEKILLLVQVPLYPEYEYGDLLAVSCLAKPIENLPHRQAGTPVNSVGLLANSAGLPADEAGKDAEFDYRMYMAKEGVLYSCANKKIQKIEENKGNIFLGGILKLKKIFENNIKKVIPQPEGALAGGLLFGGNSGLSKEIQNDFSVTGMTHIVAVSGYNVTIIAEYLILLGIALGLWRKQSIWFAVFGIIIFVIMIGLPSSAVRAAVMSGILLWAMKVGRLANSENAIIFAGAIMLFLNPLLLRWDVGFQLSFLATLGIVFGASFWEKFFIKKHKDLGISEIIMMSLSAQVFVLPIIAYNFHIASVVSLLANIFILPIIPLSMLLVFLVTLSGFISAPLASVFAWLAFLPLKYEIDLIHILAQFPWASISVKSVSVWQIGIYYLILIAGMYYFKKHQNNFEL